MTSMTVEKILHLIHRVTNSQVITDEELLKQKLCSISGILHGISHGESLSIITDILTNEMKDIIVSAQLNMEEVSYILDEIPLRIKRRVKHLADAQGKDFEVNQ